MAKINLSPVRQNAARKSKLSADQRGREMSLSEAAEFLGIKESTVRNWVFRKEVPSYLCLNRRVFFEGELKAFKENCLIWTGS